MYFFKMNFHRIKLLNAPNRHRYNTSITSKTTSIKKSNHIPQKQKVTRVNSLSDDVVSMSYIIGKGIIAFTFFYTSLNYFHYKRLREEYEDEKKDNEKK